jgi:hypothetical protein
MSNIDNLRALVAIKTEADPLAAQLGELGQKWKTASDALGPVLDKTKTYVFTMEDGSPKTLGFQNGQPIISDAIDAGTLPEPAPAPEPSAENIAPLVPQS